MFIIKQLNLSFKKCLLLQCLFHPHSFFYWLTTPHIYIIIYCKCVNVQYFYFSKQFKLTLIPQVLRKLLSIISRKLDKFEWNRGVDENERSTIARANVGSSFMSTPKKCIKRIACGLCLRSFSISNI